MAWKIEFSERADKALSKLDKQIARRILNFFIDSFSDCHSNPRSKGKALTGSVGGLWCYRVGDYRIICDIQDSALCVLLVIGERSSAESYLYIIK